ncbi:hypothetical protein KAM622c_40710 [Klebsiella quasipneumoniae subsp. quasipneumoniae]|nr:hypothetical protein KAM622c_40710 [Klebsiella quasipneumoniae subsp. quasipneumoniae]
MPACGSRAAGQSLSAAAGGRCRIWLAGAELAAGIAERINVSAGSVVVGRARREPLSGIKAASYWRSLPGGAALARAYGV